VNCVLCVVLSVTLMWLGDWRNCVSGVWMILCLSWFVWRRSRIWRWVNLTWFIYERIYLLLGITCLIVKSFSKQIICFKIYELDRQRFMGRLKQCFDIKWFSRSIIYKTIVGISGHSCVNDYVYIYLRGIYIYMDGVTLWCAYELWIIQNVVLCVYSLWKIRYIRGLLICRVERVIELG
jgi:hypothetical protein